MFDTRNDLPLAVRTKVVKLLNERPADATALGGTARGTLAQVARATSLKAYPEGTEEGSAHLAALATVLAQYGAHVRAAIEAAARPGAADTSDLFTGISPEADKYRWFLEAHLHGKR